MWLASEQAVRMFGEEFLLRLENAHYRSSRFAVVANPERPKDFRFEVDFGAAPGFEFKPLLYYRSEYFDTVQESLDAAGAWADERTAEGFIMLLGAVGYIFGERPHFRMDYAEVLKPSVGTWSPLFEEAAPPLPAAGR